MTRLVLQSIESSNSLWLRIRKQLSYMKEMADKFNMKDTYRIVESAILIDSTPASMSLYNKSYLEYQKDCIAMIVLENYS